MIFRSGLLFHHVSAAAGLADLLAFLDRVALLEVCTIQMRVNRNDSAFSLYEHAQTKFLVILSDLVGFPAERRMKRRAHWRNDVYTLVSSAARATRSELAPAEPFTFGCSLRI